eukprot:GHVT01060281.1.p1 GENE.GHVT01060281.1~~GHVT01060281.1.p1  ORF type:complete len:192 (+),score=15.82 GHVT01060281.1:129-704(+)
MFEDDKFCYAVFDLCTGGELFQRIREARAFTEEDAVVAMRQMLSAIKFCHAKGFIHRDLKAENFMYMTNHPNSRVVMIDFGLAVHIPKEGKLQTLCGSPRYMAPEVFNRCYNEKCDIWSLGIIAYVMLFGRHPFANWKGAGFEDVKKAVIEMEVSYTDTKAKVPPSNKVRRSTHKNVFSERIMHKMSTGNE